MGTNISHNFLHLVFFILSLLLLWLSTTSATIIDYPDGEGSGDYKCIDKERDALIHFKSYIHHDPYGILSTWTYNEGEATNDCCDWSGVRCDNHSRVISLDLSRAYLEGNISPSLFNLSYLTYLDLGSNSFNGTIPKFVTSMTQLEYLNLGLNDLTGSIPLELGNLTNLHDLSLGYMGNCTVENLNWLSHLSRLESLDLSGISLGKVDNWVDVILTLRKLLFLDLSKCDLSQVMHPYSYSSVNSSSLFIGNIRLNENNLESSMYHWLFPLTSNNLEYLDLSGNKLDSVPKYLGNLSLVYFYFRNNSMPIELTNLLVNLSGRTSSTLQFLDVSNSQFTGSLSDDIQRFSSLANMNLSGNQLNGTISEKVWELPLFQFLDLSSNLLKGDISNIRKLESTWALDLSNNLLEGVPSEGSMLNLSCMKIDLSSNKFYGPLSIVSSSVVWLDLSNNKYYGRMSSLCQIDDASLTLLDLSNNSLTGEIPDCLWSFKYLRVLNLGQNKLSGRLPASMKYLTDLEALYLHNNEFSGEFPLSLKNCKSLNFLDLGANMFSGYVPVWIGEKLSSLYALRLTSNNFTGTIPLQLCQLANLTILDFSMNNLHGSIPTCLNNLTSMVQGGFSALSIERTFYFSRDFFEDNFVDHIIIKWQGSAREFSSTLGLVKSIDFSSNNLIGNIPYSLTDLHELISLNLSMNALFGKIPPEIGLMKSLLHLDLSRNNLSGRIPTSMSQMTSLDYLDVSCNNLSGRIPSSTQLQSFDPSRYLGNTALCGPPLTKYCPRDKELGVPSLIGQSEGGREGIEETERWFYIGGATGFAIGFSTWCSVLLLYSGWRHAFFQFMYSLEYWGYVKVMVFVSKCQRATHA